LEDQGHVMKNVHFSAMDAVSCLQNKSDVRKPVTALWLKADLNWKL